MQKQERLWLLSLDTRQTARLIPDDDSSSTIGRNDYERDAQISPDGRWIAYERRTDRRQIYVQAFPSLRGRWQVSTETDGGVYPRWSADGKELFFFDLPSGGRLFSVAVTATATSFQSGPPKLLFANAYPANPTHPGGTYHHYAVSADGQRFVIPRPASGSYDAGALPIIVVVNWIEELKARAAAK